MAPMVSFQERFVDENPSFNESNSVNFTKIPLDMDIREDLVDFPEVNLVDDLQALQVDPISPLDKLKSVFGVKKDDGTILGYRYHDFFDFENSPDRDFHASSYIKLTHGMTAYRLMEPYKIDEDQLPNCPLIVCLHGMMNSSYMWRDVVDLLIDCDHGPNARVLIFDFYGRGRTAWTGVQCSLDILVTQTKELIDALGFSQKPIFFIGYDMGGVVATGFAAKYPRQCAGMTLVGPMGFQYHKMKREALFRKRVIGELLILRRKRSIVRRQLLDFYDSKMTSPHLKHMQKQTAMVQWQLENTPGYLGAILSTLRFFPLRGMEELYAAVGRYPRPTLILWGYNDIVCNFRKSKANVEDTFPNAFIVDIKSCGHNVLCEKFDEAMAEILHFHASVLKGIIQEKLPL